MEHHRKFPFLSLLFSLLKRSWGEGHMKRCPVHLHHVKCTPAKFEVTTTNGLGDVFTKKYFI